MSTAVRRAQGFTVAAAVPALAAALAGLLIDGVYAGPASTAAMLRADDLVTAAVAVPGLAVADRAVRRGSVRAWLVTISLLAYLVYTYCYHLFGTGFNDLFLLHAAVLAGALIALVLHLAAADGAVFAERVGAGPGVRGAAVVLGTLAVALGGMWVAVAVVNAVTGDVPAGSRLVETDTVVHLGMALDLSLLVPLYAAAAVLLWRRAAWGYPLGVLALLAGILHQVGYVVAMPAQVAAGVPGAVAHDPGEPAVVLLYVLGAVLLLRRTAGFSSPVPGGAAAGSGPPAASAPAPRSAGSTRTPAA
ncbi:hypothetical protein [Actinoplanes sp. NPDC049599]|uniref:hypothetical protein n=1 Tax=Actinoplanes sp. NPDC049599 TaxID=3363903 RepID=UPI0037A37C06